MSEKGTRRPLAAQTDAAAFRIVQEALTNAIRHGEATGGETTLQLTWANDSVTVTVTNPVIRGAVLGVGGHGVIGMHERARHVGGSLRTVMGYGTFTLEAVLPLAWTVTA